MVMTHILINCEVGLDNDLPRERYSKPMVSFFAWNWLTGTTSMLYGRYCPNVSLFWRWHICIFKMQRIPAGTVAAFHTTVSSRRWSSDRLTVMITLLTPLVATTRCHIPKDFTRKLLATDSGICTGRIVGPTSCVLSHYAGQFAGPLLATISAVKSTKFISRY